MPDGVVHASKEDNEDENLLLTPGGGVYSGGFLTPPSAMSSRFSFDSSDERNPDAAAGHAGLGNSTNGEMGARHGGFGSKIGRLLRPKSARTLSDREKERARSPAPIPGTPSIPPGERAFGGSSVSMGTSVSGRSAVSGDGEGTSGLPFPPVSLVTIADSESCMQ